MILILVILQFQYFLLENFNIRKNAGICSIKYDDWEYVKSNGEKVKIFKGLDKYTTEMINKNRKARKFDSVAKEMVLVDGEVNKLLNKTIEILGINK